MSMVKPTHKPTTESVTPAINQQINQYTQLPNQSNTPPPVFLSRQSAVSHLVGHES